MTDNKETDAIKYVPLSHLIPSQHRFSEANVKEKVISALIARSILLPDGRYLGRYDNGRSLYALSEAVPVVATPCGYLLTDGHHSALATYRLGCQTLPLQIIDNWQQGINEDFWLWAAAKDYAYLKKNGGALAFPPPPLTELEDDPLRYFVGISARKFGPNLSLEESRGADYPLWIKIGKDSPFVEWYLTDHLYSLKFQYQYGDEKEGCQTLIERARHLLRAHPLPGVKIVDEYVNYSQSTQIRAWLNLI